MRKAFVKTLLALMEQDSDIYLLTGDLGFHAFEPIIEKFPDRFINCGVAEQNMMGVAAGLALAGKKPYVYSIIPFVALRCFEQIRDDICYQNLDVKIVGTGGGFSYGPLGSTHCVMEDIGILRTLPGLTVISPSDMPETEDLVIKSYQTKNPTYIKLFNAGDNKIHDQKPDLVIGDPNVLKDGKETVVIASGLQASFCFALAQELKETGPDIKVIGMHTLKPINGQLLVEQVRGFKNIFTFEEHGPFGGLGSAVAQILATSDWKGNFQMFTVADEFPSLVGKPDYLRQHYGVDKEGIKKSILENLE